MKTVAQHKYKLAVAIGTIIASMISTGGISPVAVAVILTWAIVVLFEVTE